MATELLAGIRELDGLATDWTSSHTFGHGKNSGLNGLLVFVLTSMVIRQIAETSWSSIAEMLLMLSALPATTSTCAE